LEGPATPPIIECVEHTIELMADEVRAGMARGEVRLSFQPIVELAGGQVTALEALVRWERPDRRTIRPAELIALAEESRSLLDLGAWVLERACADAAGWPVGAAPLPVHVNVSGVELVDPGLPRRVRRALDRVGLDPERLWLEVSPAVVMADERARLVVDLVRSLGVRIVLDDLGTDLPPLHELARLPVDMLKIDRPTTAAVARRPRDRALVSALVLLARTMEVGLVAEGVEDAETAAVLAELGCEAAQGYHLLVPQPAELIGDLLIGRRSRPA
jgi:EAL domain-containing protein (putative c-di-GMP-specific phosphodiesterase class I)